MNIITMDIFWAVGQTWLTDLTDQTLNTSDNIWMGAEEIVVNKVKLKWMLLYVKWNSVKLFTLFYIRIKNLKYVDTSTGLCGTDFLQKYL